MVMELTIDATRQGVLALMLLGMEYGEWEELRRKPTDTRVVYE